MSTKDTKKIRNVVGSNFQELLNQIKSSDKYEIEVVRDIISEQISRAMMSENISKAELARKLKTSPPYITKLLQGNGNFTVETLVKIGRALGLKFRPAFVQADLANQDWKVIGEYSDSAQFKQSEQKITRLTKFEHFESEIRIDSDNCEAVTETINDERIQQIGS